MGEWFHHLCKWRFLFRMKWNQSKLSIVSCRRLPSGFNVYSVSFHPVIEVCSFLEVENHFVP